MRRFEKLQKKAALGGIRFDRMDVLSAIFTYDGQLIPIISDMGGVTVGRPDSNASYFDHNYKMASAINLFIANAHEIAQTYVDEF